MVTPSTQQRILHLAVELRRAHTAPVNVRRVRECTALLVAAAGELSVEHVEELERVFAVSGEKEQAK